MLIRVKYEDERFDMVRPQILDRLIKEGKVRKFQRSDGWVIASKDNLRCNNRNDYTGHDRRMMHANEREVSGSA